MGLIAQIKDHMIKYGKSTIHPTGTPTNMAQPRKVTVILPPDGRAAQGIEVPIDTSNERWSEYTLEDGTVFRGKLTIISVVRVEDEYDPQGNPVYQVNAGPALAFIETPDHLKKGRAS